MQALILAGGQGTRLRPYTTLFPKALVPLGNMPVLELVLRQLAAAGITTITLAVGHLATLIRSYFGMGEAFGVTLTYLTENQPLGTAGPLRQIDPSTLPEHFFVLNADILCTLDYKALLAAQQLACLQRKAIATVAVYQRQTPIDFGVLTLDPQSSQVLQFTEKPTLSHLVSMGVSVFHRRVLEYIPPDTFFGFDHLMHALLQAGEVVQGFAFEGYWLDMGQVHDYETAVQDFETRRQQLFPWLQTP
jgi:NDP-mannose synthase